MSYQVVDHGDRKEQAIFGFNDDLGRNRAVSGRVVYRSSRTNGYIAFRRSGNRGAEYFLILGDPNALKFRSSLLLKIVSPFDIKL